MSGSQQVSVVSDNAASQSFFTVASPLHLFRPIVTLDETTYRSAICPAAFTFLTTWGCPVWQRTSGDGTVFTPVPHHSLSAYYTIEKAIWRLFKPNIKRPKQLVSTDLPYIRQYK